MKRCEYKVPGGKLLCAKVEAEDDKITFLQISGDFFLLPETDLEDLEGQLLGLETDPESIREKVVTFFDGDFLYFDFHIGLNAERSRYVVAIGRALRLFR